MTKEVIGNFEEGNRNFDSRQLRKSNGVIVGQRFPHALLARETTDVNPWIVFADVHRARTERFDFFRHRRIDAGDDRSNQHYRHYSDDYPDNGEKRAQLIGAQSSQRQPQIFDNVAAK